MRRSAAVRCESDADYGDVESLRLNCPVSGPTTEFEGNNSIKPLQPNGAFAAEGA
ncbi:MAG: hypothetical protein LUQ59_11325 [Methanothrix sp.]|nr:hypothetical protein [Methanothrix sp.]